MRKVFNDKNSSFRAFYLGFLKDLYSNKKYQKLNDIR